MLNCRKKICFYDLNGSTGLTNCLPNFIKIEDYVIFNCLRKDSLLFIKLKILAKYLFVIMFFVSFTIILKLKRS